MIKRIGRFAAAALMGSVLMSETAFADNVVVASQPDSGNQQTAASSSDNTVKASPNIIYANNSGNNVISSTGPTETKSYDENGVFVYNASTGLNATDHFSTTGPGGSASTDSNAQTASPAATTAASTSGQITIDQSIAKPSISSEAAILYDATTGQVLYEKNADEKLYPASTTKLMTALVAVEKLTSSDTISINASAVNNLESGATTAGMKAGDKMSFTDAMHAMLIRSACEVSNAIAEAAAGTQSDFAALMNEKARALGCTNTSFANASGLNNTNHYTTVRDMALITKAALDNETIRSITQKNSYKLPATSSRAAMTITNTNRFVAGGTAELSGYIGGKTGYTSKAGSCLATEAERNGHKLISVVFKATSPAHYTDSKALYDYGAKLLTEAGIGTADTQTAAQPGGASETAGSTAAPSAASVNTGSAAAGAWEKTSDGHWKYKKADGSYCTNEWLDLNGNSYFFDTSSVMYTGWKSFTNGSVYYFNPENGVMIKNKWVAQDGKSYYLQSDGTMARNTTIDGKYQVDANGVYVKKVG